MKTKRKLVVNVKVICSVPSLVTCSDDFRIDLPRFFKQILQYTVKDFFGTCTFLK